MSFYQRRERLLRDAAADQFEDWYRRSKGEWFDWRERLLFLRAVERCVNAKVAGGSGRTCRDREVWKILDVGAGTGRIACEVARVGLGQAQTSVVALDFSHRSLLVIQRKSAGVLVCEADAARGLPFADGSFGLIVCCQVVQHLVLEDRLRALTECRRVLRDDGWLFLSVYNGHYWRSQGIQEESLGGLYARRFRLPDLKYMASESGFSVERVEPYKHMPARLGNLIGSGLAVRLDGLFAKLPLLRMRTGAYLFVALRPATRRVNRGHLEAAASDASCTSEH